VSLTIGVDIGGTKVLGGVVDPQGNVLQTSRRATPADDVAATRDVIVEVVRELVAKHEVEAVGIGAAGWIDASRSTVLFAPNLAWRNEPLRDYVSAAVDVPVVVENDANVAAWAEFKHGAAADADDSMVMFTVGTGIGGGIVLGGQLLRGSHGMAAEVGHMLAVPQGQLCGCGRLGCIEQYASGNALVRFAREGAMTAPSSLIMMAIGDLQALDGPMVTSAA
jgi:glucokinase